MNSRNLIIGGLVIAAVAAAIIFSVSQNAQAPVAGPSATSTPQGATSTPVNPQVGGPTIATTPYTVYVGFATDFGTSSAGLMVQEGSQVVVGYEWEALALSPTFDSVILPQWGSTQSEYEVQIWDDALERYVVLGSYRSGEDIQFPRDQLFGPRKFKVLGIDPALRLCPGDRSLNWSMRFTFSAPIGLVRTPLTQDLLLLPCRLP